MPSIAFYATNREMMRTAKRILSKKHENIKVVIGKPGGGGSEMAENLIAQGVEVIIARGGKSLDIKASDLSVVVVDLEINTFDLLTAVDKARKFGHRIAAISFPNLMKNIERLGPVRDVEILRYTLELKEHPMSLLRQAMADGAQVVIGGPATVNAAQEAKIPAVLIENDEDSILAAAEEAKRIEGALRQERAKTGLISALLDYSYEGMISIDSESRITAFNPVAESVLGIRKEKALGQGIARIWADLKLEDVLTSGKDQMGQMLTVNGTDVLCNKIAVNMGQIAIAAVVTFQDVTDIQNMENRIRQRIYTSGYTATLNLNAIRGTSQNIRRAVRMAKEFALTESSVLILGETGVGKELFAQGIHNHSNRSKGPFVPINCAAVPRDLLESELFGYVGGAFTGANPKGKLGLFEQAHNGTLFLDEIGEMDLSLQGKLLRVLQERTVMRLGSDRIVHVDVRIIAATNINIKDCIAEKKFRPDLYYRLNVLRLNIPPLREREGDVAELAKLFLKNATGGREDSPRLSEAAIKSLCQYTWPGNIRELQSFMERVAVLHKQEIIGSEHIQSLLKDEDISIPAPLAGQDEQADASLIQRCLIQNNYRMSETAKQLGISRSTLWRRVKKLGLER